ncbi:hypothetical protein [Staphylococcus debuckii]|uniref:hypothetical protein n=1 Tax=Staphylococcus debuckii TaxID=2044912 RepID=UPI000F4359C0|nr:hypothetical protein [Staphylococcus debuckii]AYU54668.1 hypothetical protein CNQ82_04190 [Staphylococcus debuckii]
MVLIKIISIILLFFLWAYILYRWIKSERELDKYKEETQYYREEKIRAENALHEYLKSKESIIHGTLINTSKHKISERHKIDPSSWLDKQKENGLIPIKQSFVLKSKNGRYFQDVVKMYVNNENLIEKVMQTTDDISKAKEYRTHREASEEATKYDLKVLALNTYVKEL